ncbi:MAG: RNA polymerase sigma-54 factor [Acidobacteria bacterium]|nr:MAG: RNA polymerase sigma-54 factor [Acidobacteriota bacterium]
MVMLQHKLNVKLSQRQILTPGLVQMVSVLALNKIELKDMINAEMVENPVLEELEDSVPLIDDVGRREEERDRATSATAVEEPPLGEMEDIERPSFENFLSRPTTLTDHLMWQLGALSVSRALSEAGELIIGNLNEDGYLIASDEELMGVVAPSAPEVDAAVQQNLMKEAEALGIGAATDQEIEAPADLSSGWDASPNTFSELSGLASATAVAPAQAPAVSVAAAPPAPLATRPIYQPTFTLDELHEALELVRQLDPPGVACRDLRECLLYQLRHIQQQHAQQKNGNGTGQVLVDAIAIVDQHLRAVQMKQHKEIARAIGRPLEAIPPALEFIKTLDPRPGLQYNKSTTRLIEPDVAFIKHGDEWLCLMNDEDVPQLRLNPAYKRLLTKDVNDKDTRNYVKERYKSAIQLIKNIEQRKQTIMKVCYSIVARQQDFLEKGIDQLKPMMIKEVAEEIGVHPSTVSRAVANKYAHTPQGVFELRYFFSESVQGPEGGNTSLLILKRRVKKLIEEEDSARPLTDEQITRILQSQGIQVTRRTVAKYREDMRIPSTHQRRVKK